MSYQDTLWMGGGDLSPLQRYSQCILQLQPTGQYQREREIRARVSFLIQNKNCFRDFFLTHGNILRSVTKGTPNRILWKEVRVSLMSISQTCMVFNCQRNIDFKNKWGPNIWRRSENVTVNILYQVQKIEVWLSKALSVGLRRLINIQTYYIW